MRFNSMVTDVQSGCDFLCSETRGHEGKHFFFFKCESIHNIRRFNFFRPLTFTPFMSNSARCNPCVRFFLFIFIIHWNNLVKVLLIIRFALNSGISAKKTNFIQSLRVGSKK